MEEIYFNTPNNEDEMMRKRVEEFNKPWWEKVTPYMDCYTLCTIILEKMKKF